MISKKQLLSSLFIQELILKRIESLYSVFAYKKQHGNLPMVTKEGTATEETDNGGLFIPAGLVHCDKEGEPIYDDKGTPVMLRGYGGKEIGTLPTREDLRKTIDETLKREGIALLGKEGYASGIKLDNKFFPDVALLTLHLLRSKGLLDFTLEDDENLSIKHVNKSYHLPGYPGDTGLRTEMANCVAIGAIERGFYTELCCDKLGLGKQARQDLTARVNATKQPLVDENGNVLVPNYMLHAHTARNYDFSITGPITISGWGRFGEMAVITFEHASTSLLSDVGEKRKRYAPEEIVASYDGKDYTIVARFLGATNPGRRAPVKNKQIIQVEKDLKGNLGEITARLKAKYQLK
jgi:hypothetical protein